MAKARKELKVITADHITETPTLPFLGLLWTGIFCVLVFLSVWAWTSFIFLIGDAVGLK